MTKYALWQPYNALLAESNEYNARLTEALLRQCGISTVTLASSAEAAIKMLAQTAFDIVICDLDVKPQGGIELLKLIRDRKINPHYRVPVIVTCGAANIEAVVKARDSGMSEFLSRPISPKALYAKLHSALENGRPFVETDVYVGPDRRRKEKDIGADRRSLPEQAGE